MLKVEGLSVSYGHIRAVREASFEVPDGRIVALIGANGAGKSSTLNALTGLVPRAGRVLFDGTDIAGLQTDAIVRHGVVQVAQGRQLFPEMSIRENLELGAFLRSPAQRRDSLAQLMQRFPFLKERAEQRCGTLSGGEQQLVAILRALMGAPRLLLLDEPTLGLAPLVVKNIGAIIRELHREGLSIARRHARRAAGPRRHAPLLPWRLSAEPSIARHDNRRILAAEAEGVDLQRLHVDLLRLFDDDLELGFRIRLIGVGGVQEAAFRHA